MIQGSAGRLPPGWPVLAGSLRPRSVLLPLCAALLWCAASTLPARAQDRTASIVAGTIGGMVVDAETGRPLTASRVFLEPIESVLRAQYTNTGPPTFRFSHYVETDTAGEYVFPGIPSGHYRVHVERPGYRRAQIDVEVGSARTRVTVGLKLEPIQLPEMQVVTQPSQPYLRTASHAAERLGARRAAVLQRQATFIAGDVRSLTAGEVAEAVTLGEPDLFRALQRLPGVGRRDDYTAVLWTRGAPWVQTRVYFDGLPLYNPTHAGSLFSSISPNGVGEVTYHPGVRAAKWGEGAAGILDLRSRRGRPDAALAGTGDLSLVSAQLALDGSVLDGGIAWMVAARRTHVDLLAGAWEFINPRNGFEMPYDFADVTARLDLALGPFRVEASGLNERDRLRGDIPGLLVGNSGRWGNQVGQVTARLAAGPLEFSGMTGKTRYVTLVHENWGARRVGGAAAGSEEVTLPSLESGIDHHRSGVQVESMPGRFGRFRWGLGYEVIDDRIRYDGPFSLLAEGIPGLVRDSLGRVPFRLVGRRAHEAYWGDLRVDFTEVLSLETGLRVEHGDTIRGLSRTLLSPRVATKWQASPDLEFTAGWGRSFQYTQAIGASAGPLGPQLHLSHLWVLAGEGYPAIESTIATAGAALWLGDAWLMAANAYIRETRGVTEPDPTPGIIRADRSHAEAEGSATGIELSARRVAGRWTGSLGVALAGATMVADSLRYPSSADVRYSGDVTGAYRLNDAVRFGGAFSFSSGAPITRVIIPEAGAPRLGPPGEHRAPQYAGLDLMADYTGELAGWQVSAYLQLLNVLGRSNRVTYAGSFEHCNGTLSEEGACSVEPVVRDRFRAGLPRLPLVGLRVAF
jgi:hypothetical protein